jgi:hypothetical protein
MASLAQVASLQQISTKSAPPSNVMSPIRKVAQEATKMSPEVPEDLRKQLCSRVLWTYLVLGVILLAICFYFFALAKSDEGKYIGTRPDGFPGFVDNPWFIYVTVSVVGVLFAYGMYRGYMAAGSDVAKYALNTVFVVIAVLIVIWFYQFYLNGKVSADVNDLTGHSSRTPFFIAVSLLALLVLQFILLWNTGDRLAAYTVIPLLVVISLFTWASWELSTASA